MLDLSDDFLSDSEDSLSHHVHIIDASTTDEVPNNDTVSNNMDDTEVDLLVVDTDGLVITISSLIHVANPATSRRSRIEIKPPIRMRGYVTHNKGKTHCYYPISHCVSYANVSHSFRNALEAYSAIVEPRNFTEAIKITK